MQDGGGGNAGYRSTLTDSHARGCSVGRRGYRSTVMDRFARGCSKATGAMLIEHRVSVPVSDLTVKVEKHFAKSGSILTLCTGSVVEPHMQVENSN